MNRRQDKNCLPVPPRLICRLQNYSLCWKWIAPYARYTMPPFTPLRASPQASPEVRPKHAIPNLYDMTISSATSSCSAALSNLTPKDVRLIDEIIERSPPSATTFLTVFKAYNEVLAECNMDVANDVVYYKILLKLGVIKGHDWGTKWNTVKAQLGYDVAGSATEEEEDPKPHQRGPSMLTAGIRGGRQTKSPERRQSLQSLMRLRTVALHQAHAVEPLQSFADSISAQSYTESYTEERAEATETETETEAQTQTYSDATEEQASVDLVASYSSPRTLIPSSNLYDAKVNALELSTDASLYPPLPSIDQFLPIQAKKAILHPRPDLKANYNNPLDRPSPTPLSRQALQQDVLRNYKQPTDRRSPLRTALPSRAPLPSSRTLAVANEDTSLDEESSWKKVKMARDERRADDFRKTALIERCWIQWKRRLSWVSVSRCSMQEQS